MVSFYGMLKFKAGLVDDPLKRSFSRKDLFSFFKLLFWESRITILLHNNSGEHSLTRLMRVLVKIIRGVKAGWLPRPSFQIRSLVCELQKIGTPWRERKKSDCWPILISMKKKKLSPHLFWLPGASISISRRLPFNDFSKNILRFKVKPTAADIFCSVPEPKKLQVIGIPANDADADKVRQIKKTLKVLSLYQFFYPWLRT